MLRPVLQPVLLGAICGHVAPSALDLCSIIALGEIASPLQLLAQTHVRWPVQHAVLVATVGGDLTPPTFVQGRVLLLRTAQGVITDLGLRSSLPRCFDFVISLFLSMGEHGIIERSETKTDL